VVFGRARRPIGKRGRRGNTKPGCALEWLRTGEDDIDEPGLQIWYLEDDKVGGLELEHIESLSGALGSIQIFWARHKAGTHYLGSAL